MDDDALLALAEKLGKALQNNQEKLALAESCTGGMASGYVTAIAGSSAWFDGGYVTYSNQAKMDMLEVSAETLAQHGAVSEETAREMALGVLNKGRSSITAAITGIAGPGGGTPQKPVGMVCFAWATSGQIHSETSYFIGDRQEIRKQAVAFVINGLLKLLKP